MRRPLLGLMRKEIIQFFRDTALVVLIFYMFVEIALCGWALTLDVRSMPTAVYDADRSAASRALIDAFARLDSFTVVRHVGDPVEIDDLMERGRVQLGVIIPASFSRDLGRGRIAQVQLLFDGSNSPIASQAMADARGLLRDQNTQVTLAHFERRGLSGQSVLPPVKNLVRVWYNPEMKFVYFVMVAMLTISVLVLGIILPSASIVREKEAGTFEQLMVTPISAAELIVAKTVPLILLKLAGLTIGIAITLWVFGVPLRGNLLLFYVFSLLMLLSSMGIGMLIGTVAENLQQALIMVFFILFPVAFLSGTNVPIYTMPTFMQWLTYLSPLRYYMDAALGIFLKGVGLEILWPQALALTFYGLAFMGISTLRFRKSLA